jgi:hypothetical protein
VELDVFTKPRPEVDDKNPTGFGTTEAANSDRITRELFDFLPRTLLPALESDATFGKTVSSSTPAVIRSLIFKKKFTTSLNSQRTNVIRRIRECADIAFREHKDLPAGWSASSFNRNINELKQFLKFDVAEKAYPNLPPICYPDFKKDQANVFRVRIAAEVCNMPNKITTSNYHSAGTGHFIWQGLNLYGNLSREGERSRH